MYNSTAEQNIKGRALIAMSGGVDSAAAAALMKKAGYECVGVHMKLYNAETEDVVGCRTCCSQSDAEDARAIAYSLGMNFYVFNLSDDFGERVIHPFINAYLEGRTPNPCIECNRWMKFTKLVQRADIMHCDKIVTGHYARVEFEDGHYVLKKSRNVEKDQSYVLYFMTQEMLSRTVFPLGEYESKTDVRALAEGLGFRNASKPDSQDICFVPDGDYASFIDRESGVSMPCGNFVNSCGKILGRHNGIHRYTIGQRRGLGVPAEARLYVCRKDIERNEIVLGSDADLWTSGLIAGEFNWISGKAPSGPVQCSARTRYHAKEVPATAEIMPDGTVKLDFASPVRAVTPGQAVVLYSGDVVLGGGIIYK